MPKPDKIESIEEIKERVQSSSFIAFTDYRGLSVNEISDLRQQLKNSGSSYKVFKNTLIERALEGSRNLEGLKPMLKGPTAVAFSSADPVGPAKVLMAFAKKFEKLEIKGGVLQDSVIDIDKIKLLTTLPSKEVLISRLLGTLQAPISNLVYVLSAMPKQLLYALNAVKEQKENNSN